MTIRRLEAAEGSATLTPETMTRICAVLAEAGAEFMSGGVRRLQAAEEESALIEDLCAISRRCAQRLEGVDVLTEADLYEASGLPA